MTSDKGRTFTPDDERNALLESGYCVILPELQAVIEREGNEFREDYEDFIIWGRRNPVQLFWLGYVGVPPSSPLTDRSHVEAADVRVHGGLTCMGIVKDPQHPDYTIYGFDCMHYDDIAPIQPKALLPLIKEMGGAYRTKEYARNQCLLLAAQLKRIETKVINSKK